MWNAALIVLGFGWVLERLLKIFWVPGYFRIGIPLFCGKVAYPREAWGELDCALLAEEVRSCLFGAIAFHRLGPGEFACRESGLRVLLVLAPLMRGVIRVRAEPAVVEVRGYLNAFPLCWVLLLGAFLAVEWPFLAPAVLLPHFLGLFVSYATEVGRFRKLLNGAREQLVEAELSG